MMDENAHTRDVDDLVGILQDWHVSAPSTRIVLQEVLVEQRDEIARLRAEVERLREGLEDIVHPIVKLKQEADRSGVKLSGVAALSISNDANYLKNIARAALNGEAQ